MHPCRHWLGTSYASKDFYVKRDPKDRIHNISGTTGSQDASLVFAQEHGSNSDACARPTV